jgi:hypothetical protein
MVHRLLDWVRSTSVHRGRRPHDFQPAVEAMEERTLLSFASPVTLAAQSRPAAIVVVDLNGDGKLDLVTANNNSASISVFLNNGDGTFRAPVNYQVHSQPMSIATGDFNGDGKIDLAVANANPLGTGNVISILTGNGDGTFQAPVDYSVGSGPSSVAVGDFNGDGKSDLVVANTFSNTVAVLMGRGDGTFGNPVYYPTGTQPRSVVVADFNGDGKPDLAVANTLNNTVSILLNRGAGTFQTIENINTGLAPVALAVGDFNHDNKPDLVVANAGGPGEGASPDLGHVTVLLNNGDGTFRDFADYATDVSPASLAVADVNGDSVPDILVSNQGSNTVSTLLGNNDGTFRSGVATVLGSGPGAVAAGDLNGDHFADLVVAVNNGASNLAILQNQPDASVYNGTPSQRFVAQVYLDLLERPVDSSGLQTWSRLLDGGQSRSNVVWQIESSTEYRMLQICHLYRDILRRDPDPGGLQTQLKFLASGGTLQQLRGLLLGSQEYFSRAGQSNAGFLQMLYQDVFSRTIDSSGAVYWAGRLSAGASRTTVANEILNSLEYRYRLVSNAYLQFLRRRVDDSALQQLASSLQYGMTGEQLVATVIGSDEYFARV